MFDGIIYLINSEAFWIALGSIGALITLLMMFYEIRTSRKVAAAEFLLKLEDSFNSNEMRKNRIATTETVSRNPRNYTAIDSNRAVIDFFEDLGILSSMRVIPKELTWASFGYWILHYWKMFEDYVSWIRKNEDPTAYYNFERLYVRVSKFDTKRRKKSAEIAKKQIKEFIDDEKTVCAR